MAPTPTEKEKDNVASTKDYLDYVLEQLGEVGVGIPMAGRAESLNASAAATILLWELTRKGGVPHG